MLEIILSEKGLSIVAILTSILSLYIVIHNRHIDSMTKLKVAIDIQEKIVCSKEAFSSRSHCSIIITNLSKGTKSIESVYFEFPNTNDEYPDLEYVLVSSIPRLIESEEDCIIPLDPSMFNLPESLQNSQHVFANAMDINGKRWKSNNFVTVGMLRKIARQRDNLVSE